MKDNSNQSIDSLMTRVLEPAGLDETTLSKTLGSMMQGDVDYADLYFQVSRNESWTLEDGIIREGSFNLDQGVGVRATSGEKTGFAYSDELVVSALQQAAGAARAIVRQGHGGRVQRGCIAIVFYGDGNRTVKNISSTAAEININRTYLQIRHLKAVCIHFYPGVITAIVACRRGVIISCMPCGSTAPHCTSLVVPEGFSTIRLGGSIRIQGTGKRKVL